MQRGTNDPFFDEHLVFQFFEAPAKLFEELLTLEVINGRRFHRQGRIGQFSVRTRPDLDALATEGTKTTRAGRVAMRTRGAACGVPWPSSTWA